MLGSWEAEKLGCKEVGRLKAQGLKVGC